MAWLSRSQYNRVRSEQMANEVLEAEGNGSPASEGAGTRADVRWLRNATRALAVVYLATSSDLEAESGRASLEDRSVPEASELAMGHEMADRLRGLIDALPSEPRELIRAVYFEGLTLQEAGNRLNISKSWASRLHAKTLQRLARSLRAEEGD
jgi:RNA polymerase sigma factor for flagellar operon FliA